MNALVRFLVDDDGEEVDNDTWHFITNEMGSNMKACTGEVFGYGEGSAEYEIKVVKRGGITCRLCLEKIKLYKSIKL